MRSPQTVAVSRLLKRKKKNHKQRKRRRTQQRTSRAVRSNGRGHAQKEAVERKPMPWLRIVSNELEDSIRVEDARGRYSTGIGRRLRHDLDFYSPENN